MIGLVVITRRNRAIPLGSVFYRGALIGRVVRDGKVAAGGNGARRSFYTAKVGIGPGDEHGYNLGTRWVTRDQAVAAVLDFHRHHPDAQAWARDCPSFAPRRLFPTPYDEHKNGVRRHYGALLSGAVNRWKRERRTLFPFNSYPQQEV